MCGHCPSTERLWLTNVTQSVKSWLKLIIIIFDYSITQSITETVILFTGEQYAGADDTLVISGGLYDGPQIYNPTMTVQNEEDFQGDASGFGYASSQFRLEFLKEEQQRDPDRDTSTFQSFHATDQEP